MISFKEVYYLSYSEDVKGVDISCNKMEFDNIADLIVMKEHLIVNSCNKQHFKMWSELTIIKHLNI